MKKIKISFHSVLKWSILLIICLVLVLFVVRFFHYFKVKKINDQISKIHSTKLNIQDALGNNLPTSISDSSNSTLEGLDSNNNGIRDDVEVAIFKKYPNSEKTRAVLLQYAMTLQMETLSNLDRDIVIKIINEQSRADTCLADTLVPRVDDESPRTIKDLDKIEEYTSFVREKQFNTEERKSSENNFYKYLDEVSKDNYYLDKKLNEKENSCDIDISILKN